MPIRKNITAAIISTLVLLIPLTTRAQAVGNYTVTFSSDAASYAYSATDTRASISITAKFISATSQPVSALEVDFFVIPSSNITTPFNLAAATAPYCEGTTDSAGSTTCAFTVKELEDTGNGGYYLVATYTPYGATAKTYTTSSAQVFTVSGLPETTGTETGSSDAATDDDSTSTTKTTTSSSSSSSSTFSIPNPIKCNDATCLITQVIKAILGVIAIIATIMFVWGGVMMLTSGGNEKRVTQAKETLVWAVIGIVVIIISWAVIKFVLSSLLGKTE